MSDAICRVPVTRFGLHGTGTRDDAVAVEEPLEIRLHGKPFVVIMRTPGEDRELAAGFLLSEGVLESAGELGAVEHCRHPEYPQHHNIVDVFMTGQARERVARHLAERRQVTTNASCGLCGRTTIESLQCRAEPLTSTWSIEPGTAAALPGLLRERQRLFEQTGGLHAAGLFTPDRRCLATAEDVGRHNAVDKVVGRMVLEERLPLSDVVLAVSGRASFEIVQKAWIAGIPLVCAVSAPSSLAIGLAKAAGVTLIGFTRDGTFNVYTHAGRVAR